MSINEMERKVREMRELQTLIEEATAEVEALKDAIKAATLCIIRLCSRIHFRLCAAVLLRAISSVLRGGPKTATAVFL